jgi:hypothetical protein
MRCLNLTDPWYTSTKPPGKHISSRPHSDTPHSEGLLWTSDQPDAQTSTWQHTAFAQDRNSCPSVIRNSPSDRKSTHSTAQLLGLAWQNHRFIYFGFDVFRSEMEERILNKILTSIPRIKCFVDVFSEYLNCVFDFVVHFLDEMWTSELTKFYPYFLLGQYSYHLLRKPLCFSALHLFSRPINFQC